MGGQRGVQLGWRRSKHVRKGGDERGVIGNGIPERGGPVANEGGKHPGARQAVARGGRRVDGRRERGGHDVVQQRLAGGDVVDEVGEVVWRHGGGQLREVVQQVYGGQVAEAADVGGRDGGLGGADAEERGAVARLGRTRRAGAERDGR
ncbi:extensin [Gracilaria domingensis]|nr:extensin [Gracilaria domingensis]